MSESLSGSPGVGPRPSEDKPGEPRRRPVSAERYGEEARRSQAQPQPAEASRDSRSGSEPLVRLRGVTRTFDRGRVVAADRIDLDIARGEFVALTGPSGSGKTTLLNLVGAMDLADEGEVVVDGMAVRDRESMERVRATKIGFVFQRHNLIPVLSAVENVEIPMVPRPIPRRERRERARALLGQVGLGGRGDTSVRVLSGGERQRVAVARAMANEAPLILADEPTGNLDSRTGQEVMEVLHALRARTGAALVLVTHNPEICAGCDRHLEMRDGRLTHVGT